MTSPTAKIIRAFLAATPIALASLAPSALAAGNGSLGASSSGSIGLRVTIPKSFSVKDVSGITVDEFDGARFDRNGRICVWGNLGGSFSIRVTSRNGVFALAPPSATPSVRPMSFTAAAGNAQTAEGFCPDGTALAIRPIDATPDPSASFLKTGTVIMTVAPD